MNDKFSNLIISYFPNFQHIAERNVDRGPQQAGIPLIDITAVHTTVSHNRLRHAMNQKEYNSSVMCLLGRKQDLWNT